MNIIIKKIGFIVILILTILNFNSCWNRRELSELGIVGTAAIDEEDSRIKITYELLKPYRMETPGSEEPSIYFQSEGQTIFEANRNATLKFDKKLYWPQAKAYFFNENIAKKGLLKQLDYFNRNHESRRYVNLAIAKGVNASEIIGIIGIQGEIPSQYIEKLFDNSKNNGKSVSTKLIDFLKMYYAEGLEPVVAAVQIVKRNSNNFKVKKNEGEDLMTSAEGCAVFKGDQFVGFLDGIETRGYNFIIGDIKSAILVSPSPDGKGENSVEVIKAGSKIEIQKKDNAYSATVKIEIHGVLGEETGEKKVDSIEEIKKVENNTSDMVKAEILQALNKVQEYGSDIFGFGQELHIKFPEEWKQMKNNWNELFSKLKIEVEVKTTIDEAGVSNEQLPAKE